MATTTTLLLVLATTAGLFDLAAAARCKVMKFMDGHLEPLDGTLDLVGIAAVKSDDPTKIKVLDPGKTGTWPSAPKLIHAVFGTKPTYKWYTAVAALVGVAKAGGAAVINHESNGNFNVFDGPTGRTITDVQWTAGVALDPVGKGTLKQIAWLAFVEFEAIVGCKVMSVYLNMEPSFRAGPMRYVKHKGKAVLTAVEKRSQQKFKLQVVTIDSGAGKADNTRLFYGYGTFENAEVAMDVHFQADSTVTASGNAIPNNDAGFVYHDFATGDAKLITQAATDVVITGDAHSLGWIAAYDPTLREFAFYQKMTHMGDGFHNGKLTMGKSGDATAVGLQGTIVFASRDKGEFILYLPQVKLKDNQDEIRAFYGKKPWSAEMETALDAIGTTPADDAGNEIYLSPTGNWDVTSFTNNAVKTNPGLHKFDLKGSDKCGMVKWVAFRQTKGDKKYLAHRDMTKKM